MADSECRLGFHLRRNLYRGGSCKMTKYSRAVGIGMFAVMAVTLGACSSKSASTATTAAAASTTAPTATTSAPPKTREQPTIVPPTTAPPQTAPPQTAPPQTAPPQTAPPQTAPPQTAPPQTAPPAAPPANIVYGGAFCSTPGATGVTSGGKLETCSITATDSRYRWRSQ